MVLYKTELHRSERRPVLIREREVSCGVTRTPDSVAQMLNDVFHHGLQTEEVIYEICYDTACHPIGAFEVSRGTVTNSICTPREVFQRALLCGAVSIVIAHNHPSGALEPSDADMECMDRLKQAGDLIGIKLIDFLIVSDVSFYSLM